MKTFPTSAAWCFWILYISVSLKTTGSSEVVGSADPVVALAGDDVILPCSLKPSVNAEDMAVKWTRSYLKTENVHFYRNGRDSNEEQVLSYKGRTSMFFEELKNGNVSLKLTRVTLSDPGGYKCFIPKLTTSQVKETTVQLFVGAVSQPVISIVGTKGLGVVLRCESGGWYPEPGMEWLDSAGTILPADGPPERHRDSEALYTLRRHVTVNKTDTNRFTCRVQQLEIKHLRETEFHVPDDVFPKSLPGWIVGLIAAAVVVVAALVGVCIQHIKEKRRKELEELKKERRKELEEREKERRKELEELEKEHGKELEEQEKRRKELEERVKEFNSKHSDEVYNLYLDALNNLIELLEITIKQREITIKQREKVRKQRVGIRKQRNSDKVYNLYLDALHNLIELLEMIIKLRGPSTDSDEEQRYLDALNNLIKQLERIIEQRVGIRKQRDSDEEQRYLDALNNLIKQLERFREQSEKVRKQRERIRKQRESAVEIFPTQTPSTSPGGQQTTQTPSLKETGSIEGMEMETLPGPEMEMESKSIEGMETETLLGPGPERDDLERGGRVSIDNDYRVSIEFI